MKTAFKSTLLASLLATVAFSASAQTATAPAAAPMEHGMKHHGGHMDGAKMEQMMVKHMAELKTKLKITPAQESAWTTFTTAMKPDMASMGKRPDMAEMDKLSTPERLDKMQAMHKERMAEHTAMMEKRHAAIKAFYATLSPAQQKTFDAEHARMAHHHMGMHHDDMDKKPMAAPAAK